MCPSSAHVLPGAGLFAVALTAALSLVAFAEAPAKEAGSLSDSEQEYKESLNMRRLTIQREEGPRGPRAKASG